MSPVLQLRIGAIVALVLLLFGFVSIVWTPYPVSGFDIGAALQGPSGGHWLGTDQLGRDVLSLLMKAMLTSFVVSAVGVAVAGLIGIGWGLLAARWGGVAEFWLLEASEFFYAFPALVVAVVLATAFGPGAAIGMVAVGLYGIPAFARAAHDGASQLEQLDYVGSGRLAGLSGMDLWRRHIVPDLLRLLLAVAIEVLAMGVLAEAAIAYVGIGTQAPAASLGLMLRDGQASVAAEPLLVVFPGLAAVAIALALNAAASGLRRLLDPELRGIGVVHGAT